MRGGALRLVLMAALVMAGCTSTSAQAPAAAGPRVTGTVTWTEGIPLPPSSVLKVQLVDVSRADAPAVVLGEQIIAVDGRPLPYAFSIAYDPAKIDPRFTYAVAARIEDEGRLLFISDRRYAVLTRGAPGSADLVVRPVGKPPPR